MWNQYNQKGPRTNNHVEGYNLRLNKLLRAHPNIWKFIDELKEEDSRVDLRWKRFNLKTAPPSTASALVINDEAEDDPAAQYEYDTVETAPSAPLYESMVQPLSSPSPVEASTKLCNWCKTPYKVNGVKRHEFSCRLNPKNILQNI